jgi:hypothetical protein
VGGAAALPSDAEDKLARLVEEMGRHRESARDHGQAGYSAMAERHERLVKLVCAEIRRHCIESGLALPDDLRPEELD